MLTWLAADSFVFLLMSMIVIASSLYLPEHITNVGRRAAYYYNGEHYSVGSPQGLPVRLGEGLVGKVEL